jgi:hypothetical protein
MKTTVGRRCRRRNNQRKRYGTGKWREQMVFMVDFLQRYFETGLSVG